MRGMQSSQTLRCQRTRADRDPPGLARSGKTWGIRSSNFPTFCFSSVCPLSVLRSRVYPGAVIKISNGSDVSSPLTALL